MPEVCFAQNTFRITDLLASNENNLDNNYRANNLNPASANAQATIFRGENLFTRHDNHDTLCAQLP